MTVSHFTDKQTETPAARRLPKITRVNDRAEPPPLCGASQRQAPPNRPYCLPWPEVLAKKLPNPGRNLPPSKARYHHTLPTWASNSKMLGNIPRQVSGSFRCLEQKHYRVHLHTNRAPAARLQIKSWLSFVPTGVWLTIFASCLEMYP